MALIRCNSGHVFSERMYGNICPYCNTRVRDDQNQKMAQQNNGDFDNDLEYAGELEVIDPVVGWLVCTYGPQKGRDYKIMAEKNFIGRAEDMHIQVLGDHKIARRNHAIIVYDPLKRNTLILPGDSSGLVYHQGEAVYTPTQIQSHDTIQLGDSKFLFVSLCGEHWEWENLQDGEMPNQSKTSTDNGNDDEDDEL